MKKSKKIKAGILAYRPLTDNINFSGVLDANGQLVFSATSSEEGYEFLVIRSTNKAVYYRQFYRSLPLTQNQLVHRFSHDCFHRTLASEDEVVVEWVSGRLSQYDKSALSLEGGGWGLPKGKVEPDDESIRSTALREFKEETGLWLNSDQEKYLTWLGEYEGKQSVIHLWSLPWTGVDLTSYDVRSHCATNLYSPDVNQWPMLVVPETDYIGWRNLTECRSLFYPTSVFTRAIEDLITTL